MSDEKAGGLHPTKTQALAGVIVVLIVGMAGGNFLGFTIQPKECSECATELARCEARDELINDSLQKAEEAVIAAYRECRQGGQE
jgi:hypothetical protein